MPTKKKILTERRKSELCLLCGKCCMSMTFLGGEVDDESRDEIYWMELHGFKIEYVKKGATTEYYFSIPQRCNALQEIKNAEGVTNYVCGVYETRPQMCRDYDGRIKGPFGVKDCFWRLEEQGEPLPLVQIGK
ncbi:MAG TPA: YkgJ family cysteine cluster protein [Blastocatellia bacterium]|nr:YkgJ family cysteine cluster protein [Blastocatellia bacterium]